MHRLFLTCLIAASLLFTLPACSTNPATGKSQFNLMSTEQELRLGQEAMPKFLSSNGGEIPSAEIVNYVRSIGSTLAGLSERPELPWEFHVIDSAQVNAFALPGGKVFFSRGLLAKMDNEAQLAGVLGHEVGHVTAQHIGQQMSQRIAVGVTAAALGVAGGVTDNDYLKVLGAGAGIGGTVYLLKFGRDQESESDMLGMRYMVKAGYNPVGMLQVMKILKTASGGGGGQPEWLSTHPLPDTRISRVNALIQKRYPDYADNSKYTFNHTRFQQVVPPNLKRLPKAKHGSKKASLDGKRQPQLGPVRAAAFACWCGNSHQAMSALGQSASGQGEIKNARLAAAMKRQQALRSD
jgi:predicted Zn-dependent protease